MSKKKFKIYFANGLFSEAERDYNDKVVKEIRSKLGNSFEVFLPQEAPINDKSTYADSKMIAKLDTDKLLEADVLVAVLDGVTIDAGVASEIGAFYTTGKPIIGLYTDVRRHGADNQDKLNALQQVAESQFHYLNLYTVGLVKTNGLIVTSTDELITELVHYVNNTLVNAFIAKHRENRERLNRPQDIIITETLFGIDFDCGCCKEKDKREMSFLEKIVFHSENHLFGKEVK